MDVNNLYPYAIRLRLETLFMSLSKIDYKSAKIKIDRSTFYALRQDPYSMRHLDLCGGQMKWYGVPIEICAMPMPEPMWGDDCGAEYADCVLPKEPFCLYIEYEKRNGRRGYIDDPQTDKAYL
ncbi:hypothetical protein E2A64_10445 [Pseudohoeflea suaedae]|uniref:Uncharacterized protein n=1 Tax=Pseudohoeflea suaedae TaxID=877384 RepID=A0A4R5PJJ5_9HYPH|nr:hypothetical protein [Pseudohoeflea suaedae]TDH35745.1 hypothetical protein E2A64_10445 [Pseudohoeflea suaedae]